MNLAIGGLARRLIKDCLISEDQAEKAVNLSAASNTPFTSHLVKTKQIDGYTIAKIASQEFGIPLLDLFAIDQNYIPATSVESRLILEHHVLPLFIRGNKLYVAVSDPANHKALNEIEFHTGLSVEMVVAEEEKLSLAIERLSREDSSTNRHRELNDIKLEELTFDIDTPENNDDDIDAADAAPIVRAVNKILIDAVKSNASDIHIEPYEKSCRIRYRTDGILHEIANPPINIAGRIAARLKIMSQMDISERRIPQDGRIRMKLSSRRTIDFRVNAIPTLWGEKIVLRILDPSQAQIGVDALGFENSQKNLFMDALDKTQGMILVTGPTGSGKTVSLYTGLSILNTSQRNISTAEDPVEINLDGVNQLQVNPKIGLSFAKALRAFLRQDPDVVMVGEIRDLETAEIATKAAQTGHLVLSTLHTNSAPEAISRLVNIGIPNYTLATSISLVIAQRLARRLCDQCKEIAVLPEKVLVEEGFKEDMSCDLSLFRAVGCKYCKNGYKGRVGIYEVVPINEAMTRIIIASGNSIDIAEQAQREGFNTLRQSALLKVAQGLTSLEEANRLT